MEQLAKQVEQLIRENARLKDVISELKREFESSTSKPMACRHCKHFIQHYVKGAEYIGGYSPIDAGHCTKLRSRKDKNGDDSCKYFELGTYEERFLER